MSWTLNKDISTYFVIHFIVKPLTHIINLSLSMGIVPERIKIAKVIPVYKKGDPEVSDNYRPVSVLSGFSKINVFERIHVVYTQTTNSGNDQLFDFSPQLDTAIYLNANLQIKQQI